VKIAVIAANGRSGQVFVRAALRAGHEVRAGVHRHNPFLPDQGLEVVTCDATRAADLEKLLAGQDAVVCLIGHVKQAPPDVQTRGAEKTIAAMHKLGIKRLVSLTGTGVRFPGDKITLMDRLLNLAIGLIDPARVRDGREHVARLQQSDLDWTVIRVLKLQDTPPKPFVLRENGPAELYTSRQEVAQAILTVLSEDNFVRKAPIISPKGR